jgi:hypothetical protein
LLPLRIQLGSLAREPGRREIIRRFLAECKGFHGESVKIPRTTPDAAPGSARSRVLDTTRIKS